MSRPELLKELHKIQSINQQQEIEELLRIGGNMYSIMNGENNLLNIRKFDEDENTIWNSFKEKRFWFTLEASEAHAQNVLLNKKGENSTVVEIIRILREQND